MSERIVEITIGGEMDDSLCDAFDDVQITVGHGVSRLRVACPDASALHGVLGRIASHGLDLLDVRQIEPGDR